jgi:branched-chain amino acid transport system substrate-binding protein
MADNWMAEDSGVLMSIPRAGDSPACLKSVPGRCAAGVLSVVVLGASLAGCARSPETAPASGGTFKVGVLLPLTGATAWGGRPARVAAELAAEEVNAAHLAGSSRLELVFADGTCEPRTTYTATDKLITQDHVQALIGEWCSSASIAAAQVASDAKVPMLVQISTADGIAKSAGPYVFQSIMQNSAIQEREAKLLLEKFRFKTAAILVENNDFGLSFRDNIRKTLERAGVRIVLDIPQDRQDANWYSTITRIKGAAPDIVLMSISAGQAANFIKQYAESNVTTPLFSDYTPPPYIFERQVGAEAGKIGLVRGAFFLNNPDATPRQKAFVARFEPAAEKALGEKRPAVHWDIVTYDAVMLIADAVRRGGVSTPGLLAAIAETKYDGVLGRYEFDRDRGIKPEGFGFLFIRTTPEGGLDVVR